MLTYPCLIHKRMEGVVRELILQYREGGHRRNAAFSVIYPRYEKMIMGILIQGGSSNVGIKDTPEYAEACLAFTDAIMRFDLNSGIEFSTFATHHIRMLMRRHYSSYVCGVNRFAEDFSDYENRDEDEWCPAADEAEDIEPWYMQCDRMDTADSDLNSRFQAPIAFALKALSGLTGFSKLGRIQVFKLIGTQHRDELTDLMSSFGLDKSCTLLPEDCNYVDIEDSSSESCASEEMNAAVPAA